MFAARLARPSQSRPARKMASKRLASCCPHFKSAVAIQQRGDWAVTLCLLDEKVWHGRPVG
eukprot:scaffold9874_cov38-Tisochrysis_lutea.AAC.2